MEHAAISRSLGVFVGRRRLAFGFSGLVLLLAFQNCSAPTTLTEDAFSKISANQKGGLEGRYQVTSFIATSSCPDVDGDSVVCGAVYKEDLAAAAQSVEFMSDGTLVLEGSCNTYYSNYEFSSNGTKAEFHVAELSGTENPCSGADAREEELLVHRLGQAVTLIEEGPAQFTIFTDQSSAVSFTRN